MLSKQQQRDKSALRSRLLRTNPYKTAPFFSKEDFSQLLQKVAISEIRIHHLEEVNALNNETTLAQNSETAVWKRSNAQENGS